MSENTNASESTAQKIWKQTCNVTRSKSMFSVLGGNQYSIHFNLSKVCKVGIIKAGAKGVKKMPVIRFDKAHRGANYNHININPKISGIKDPHLPLPAGALTTAVGVGKTLKWYGILNKYVLFPAYVVAETVEVGMAIAKDVENESSRNTVEKGANMAGSIGAGCAGTYAGFAIGTAILPGVGTIVGGIVGSLIGTFGGSYAADAIVETIGDSNNYGIVVKQCKQCGNQIKIRKYQGKPLRMYCIECLENYRPAVYAASDSHKVSICYLRKDGTEEQSSEEDLNNWFKIVSTALRLLVGGKAAVAMVRVDSGEIFKFPKFANQECVEWDTIQNEKATYHLSATRCWSSDDLQALITKMKSDLSSLWFMLTNKKYSILDFKTFYDGAKVFVDGPPEDYGFQIIGHSDGVDEIFWLNRNQNDVKCLLSGLQAHCTNEEFNFFVGELSSDK